MNVGELLEELRENLLRDVSDVVGSDVGHLFTDKSLVRYLDEAHKKAARRSQCIRDAKTPEITTLTLTQGVSAYEMSSRIIRVLSVSYGADRRYRPLKQASLYDITDRTSDYVGAIPCGTYVDEGVPTHYTVDEGSNYLRLFKAPGAELEGETLHMRVVRLPAKDFTLNDLKATPEIPEDYHLDLVDWAAFRALRNHDVDAENLQKANPHRASFNAAMAELSRETRRKYFEPFMFGGFTTD